MPEDQVAEARGELVLTGGGSTLPSASERLSAPLWKWLTKPGESKRVVPDALETPIARDLIREAAAAVPVLDEACVPGGADAVTAVLAKLLLSFGGTARTGAQFKAYSREVIEAVGFYPRDAIFTAARLFRDDPDSKTMPLPGELAGLAKPEAEKIRVALYRARLLANATEKAAPRADDPVAKAEALAIARDFLAGVKTEHVEPLQAGTRPDAPQRHVGLPEEVWNPAKPKMRPTHGALAPGSALTPAMLRALGRKVPEAPRPEPDDLEFAPREDDDPPPPYTDAELAEMFPF